MNSRERVTSSTRRFLSRLNKVESQGKSYKKKTSKSLILIWESWPKTMLNVQYATTETMKMKTWLSSVETVTFLCISSAMALSNCQKETGSATTVIFLGLSGVFWSSACFVLREEGPWSPLTYSHQLKISESTMPLQLLMDIRSQDQRNWIIL